jgi:acyl carrier protein
MNRKHELSKQLRQIISLHLGVPEQQITEESTWVQLGADSLDRLEMSLAIENTFKVQIPHVAGERLNTVGETVNHLLALVVPDREASHIRIEAATTNQQWVEMSGIRDEVFGIEHGYQVRSLPEPGELGVWHLLARDQRHAVGTLSVVDTTGKRRVHRRYRLAFGDHDRVARYAQLAILKPYRKRGIFKMLIEAAQRTVILPNGFGIGWLLYPEAHARSFMLTHVLGFTAEPPLLRTEFGNCHVLIRRESMQPRQADVHWANECFPPVETCPI